MVVKTISEDIFNTDAKHIAFAINKEGFNDSGFAGVVARKCWPELVNTGEKEIGTVLSKTVGEKTFHGLVCHSLEDGWGDNQREIIKTCFDKIPTNGEKVATIAIGTGFMGMLGGANFREIICGMHDSSQQVTIYANLALEDIMTVYEEENAKRRKF